MKKLLCICTIFVFVLLIAGCSTKEYNSNYKSVKGYTEYVSNSKSGCKHMNSFGLQDNLNTNNNAKEYYDNNVRKNGDFMITNYLDGICINRYVGKSSDVEIPNEIDGKPVIMLGQDPSENFFSDNYDVNLKIPENVKYICSDVFVYYDDDGNIFNVFNSIKIDKNNPYYYSYDNSIYTKDKKTVLYYYISNLDPDDNNGTMLDTVENFEPINPLENQAYSLTFSKNIKSIDACIDLGEWETSPKKDAKIKPFVKCYKNSVAIPWAEKHGLKYGIIDNSK